MQHVKILRVRIIMRKGEIKVGVERNHVAAELLQYFWSEGPGGAIAARGNNFQLAREFRPVGQVGKITSREILDETIGTAIRVAEFSLKNDLLQAAHLVATERHRAF